MSDVIVPMSISIVPNNGGKYKTISTLSWADVPGFAILTGKNGSGKTQLLEILAYHLSGAPLPGMPINSLLPVKVTINGPTYQPDDIAYVPSDGRFSGGSGSSIMNVQNFRQQALQPIQESNIRDIPTKIRSNRIKKRVEKIEKEKFIKEEFKNNFPILDVLADDIDIMAALSHVFLDHRLRLLESLERGKAGFDEDGKLLGPAPWDMVNEALQVSGFPYQVVSPEGTKLTGNYTLRFKDRQSNVEIAGLDLSSGEKVLLQLVLWLYAAGASGQFPKLLLLDEPDAHLHPSMTTQFLDVILEVLVNRHGVRVIMTTHSPSTVALAPEGSVFQIERGATTVTRIDRIPDIISVLTAGLITVSRMTKFCFVEDEADVNFYNAVRDVLMEHGPSRDPEALRPSPSIVFLPASVGTGRQKVSGGHGNVTKWVGKLDDDPLNQIFCGIIDRDDGNKGNGRIHVLERYSYENYLLDPLNIFCLLLENGNAPNVDDVKISSGNEHLLREQNNDALQKICKTVTDAMEKKKPCLSMAQTSCVTYTIGRKIVVPCWVVNHRGHDLLQIAQKAFGGHEIINAPRLIKALRRGRLIPIELAYCLKNIQKIS